MKPIRVIALAVVVLLVGTAAYLQFTKPSSRYTNTRDIDGDWVITDYQVFEDTLLNVNGKILLEGDGHLVLRNCYLNFEQEYNNQYGEYLLDLLERPHLDQVRQA